MNNTLYSNLTSIIPEINSFINEINEYLCNDKIKEYICSDYGIFNSLEYIRDYLILQQFKQDFNYFNKEVNYLIEESKGLNDRLKEFLLFKVDYDDYDQYEYIESILLNINKKYLNILDLIESKFKLNFNGIGSKEILKRYFDKSSTEDLLNLFNQPKNTCPLIDEAIEFHPLNKNDLELLRRECEYIRDKINYWKEELWKNSQIELTHKGYSLYFKEITLLDLKYNEFNFNNKKSKNAFENYKKIIDWGLNYYNFVLKNNIIKLEYQ